MRVSNEPGGTGPSGAFSELFRLQADFQARLAEETLRYLRRLQGAVVPAAPGTVMMPADGAELRALAAPGGRAELSVEIENLQRVHCMVTPQLTPLVSPAGVTWFPAAELATSSRLVPPGGVERIAIPLPVPPDLPPGEYRGALLLQGFRQNTVAVAVTVVGGATPPEETEPGELAVKQSVSKKSTGRKSTARKTTARKSTARKHTPKKSTPKTSAAKKSTSKKAARKKSERVTPEKRRPS